MNYTYEFIGKVNTDAFSALKKEITNLKDLSSLTINMNSFGGEVQSAIALYNYLKIYFIIECKKDRKCGL